MAKKLQGWMIGGITGLVAFLILFGIKYFSPVFGTQLWDFFSKIYLTNSLSNPFLDIITIAVRWILIGAIIGLIVDLARKKNV